MRVFRGGYYFKNKGIEFKVPPNSTSDDESLIKNFQESGSQGHADAVGDKLIGKDPKMVNVNGGYRKSKIKSKKIKFSKNRYKTKNKKFKKNRIKYGGKCDSFQCPKVEYKPGSSSNQAINSLNKEEQSQINLTNQASGMAKPNNLNGSGKYSRKKKRIR